MPDKLTFGSRLVGNRLIVYNNRVEIIKGWIPFRKKTTLPFSAIASVEKARVANRLIIRTNDGKKHTFGVGNAGRIQQAILERM